MLTEFQCRNCGHNWNSEGTPHYECPKCENIGFVIKDDYSEYCIDCEQPIWYSDDGKERCGCPVECPCGCGDDPARCVYASQQG